MWHSWPKQKHKLPAHLDQFLAMLQQAQQLGDEVIQVACQNVLIAVLAEVHNGCRCMGLHSGLTEVLHDLRQGWHNGGVLIILNVWAQVGAHLANCLTGSPAHLGVGILQPLYPRSVSIAVKKVVILNFVRIKETKQ